MFQDPLVLDIWFLLHMGKDLFLQLLCLLWYPKPLEVFSVTMITPSESMIKTSQIIKDMRAVDMSVGSTTVMEDMEVKDDFWEITTIDHDDPSSALHVINKDTTTQTVHTRI